MKVITISKELEELLKKANNPIAWSILDKHIDKEVDPKYIDYLGLSNQTEGYISYLTKDRIEKFGEEEYWSDKRRYHTKIATIAEKLYPNVYSQREIEILGNVWRNLFKQQNLDTSKVILEEGDKISWCYHERNYATEGRGASLNYSCMRYSGCQKFFDLYTKNVNKISLAVMYEDDQKVKARCLIWFPNGKEDKSLVYYDRVYAISSVVAAEMQAILDCLGFINVSDKNEIKPQTYQNITIDLEFGEESIDYWPYMDTFMYIEDTKISNFYRGNCAELQSQDGGNDRTELSTCDHCGERTDETYYIVAGTCRGDNVCEECAIYSEHYNGYLDASEAIETYWEEETALSSDIVSDYSGRTMLSHNAVRLYDGKFSYKNDPELEESEDGLLFLRGNEDFIEIEDSAYYYKDSTEIEEIEGIYYLIGSNEYEKAIEKLILV